MTTEQLVPVPEILRQRAWECAQDIALIEVEGRDRVVLTTIRSLGTGAVTWALADWAFRLHRQVHGKRAT